MGYNDTMDIRGIAWAGYFFDPNITTQYVCAEPPEIDVESVTPIISRADGECLCD